MILFSNYISPVYSSMLLYLTKNTLRGGRQWPVSPLPPTQKSYHRIFYVLHRRPRAAQGIWTPLS